MNQSGLYGNITSIDDFEIGSVMWHNGNNLPTIYSNTHSFIPWGLTEQYYNDVILCMVSDMREDKIKELVI
jgi:hypothetical protein